MIQDSRIINGVKKMSKKQKGSFSRQVDRCQECGSPNRVHDYDTGETVCGGCGLVDYVYNYMYNRFVADGINLG